MALSLIRVQLRQDGRSFPSYYQRQHYLQRLRIRQRRSVHYTYLRYFDCLNNLEHANKSYYQFQPENKVKF